MALDFPASPVNGQIFQGTNGVAYIFNSAPTPGYWSVQGSGTTSVIYGDTPPASPNAGQLWWNSALGQMFLWFNDGSSTQWVPTAPAVYSPSTVWRQLSRVVPTAGQADVSFQNIPADINSIELMFDVIPTATGSQLLFRYFDGAGAILTSGYGFTGQYTQSISATRAQATTWNGSISGISNGIPLLTVGDANLTAGAGGIIKITNIKEAARVKRIFFQSSSTNGAGSANNDFSGTGYNAFTALSGVRLVWGSTTFAAGGAVTLWGSP